MSLQESHVRRLTITKVQEREVQSTMSLLFEARLLIAWDPILKSDVGTKTYTRWLLLRMSASWCNGIALSVVPGEDFVASIGAPSSPKEKGTRDILHEPASDSNCDRLVVPRPT